MRWAESRRLMLGVLIAGLTHAAHAQDLDLDVPEPAPGASAVHLIIADEMQESASILRMNSQDRERSAPAAIRELASALIERGLRRQGEGAELLISGLTLAGNLEQLDAVIENLDPMDRMTLAADLRRLAATLSSDVQALDRALRDSLAILTKSVGANANAGWLGRDTVAPDSQELIALVDRDPVASAPGLLRLIEEARTDTAYRSSADRLARHLVAASIVLDPPDWMTDIAQRTLSERYAEAVRQSLGGNAIQAAQELSDLTELGRLLQTLGELPETEEIVLARAHAETIAADSAPIPLRLVRLGHQIALAASIPEPESPPPSFVRELRPVWADLRSQARTKQAALIPFIAPALRNSLGSDPAVLAALASARRVHHRLEDLNALNLWLKGELAADSPAVAHRDHRMLAAQTGRFSREAGSPLWKLADQARRFANLPAEEIWRDPDTVRVGWIRTIDALVPDLGPATDELRAQWESEWASGNAGGDAAGELEAGYRLMTILEAIGISQQADADGWVLARWPGWYHDENTQLSPALAGNISPLAVLVAAYTDPLTRVDLNELSKVESSFAAVRAVAALEHRIEQAGRAPGTLGASSVISQLGLGSPDLAHDPLATHRGDIAELNRRVLEAVALEDDEQWADQALDYANDAGMQLLEQLGPPTPGSP